MLQTFTGDEEIPPPPEAPAPAVPNDIEGEHMDIDDGSTLGTKQQIC